jgi:hypothetical protein
MHATVRATSSAADLTSITHISVCIMAAIVHVAHDQLDVKSHLNVLQPAAVRDLLAHAAAARLLFKHVAAAIPNLHTRSSTLPMGSLGMLPQQCHSLLHLLLLLLLQSVTHKSAMQTPTAGVPDTSATRLQQQQQQHDCCSILVHQV